MKLLQALDDVGLMKRRKPVPTMDAAHTMARLTLAGIIEDTEAFIGKENKTA